MEIRQQIHIMVLWCYQRIQAKKKKVKKEEYVSSIHV